MGVNKPTYEELEAEVKKLRKHAELELIEAKEQVEISEERLRALYNNSPDMFVSVSAKDASILQCNEKFTKEMGYSRSEVIGAHIFSMYQESCIPDVEKAFQQFVETGEVSEKELVLKRKDGSSIEVSLNVSSVKDKAGNVLYSTSSYRDITEKKKAEKALRKTLKSLSNSQKLAKVGSWEWDILTGKVEWSDETYHIFGLDSKTFKPQIDSVMSRFHPDDQKQDEELINMIIAKRKKYNFESRIILPDGSIKFLTGISEGRFDDNDNLTQISGTLQDITKRKDTEGKLKMFSRVVDHSLNAFDIINHKGEFIYVNQAYADMWGYKTTDEIIGTSPVSHFADEHLAGHIVSEIKKNGKFISEIKAKRKDGSIFDALMYARLDFDENGNEIYPTTSLDITDSKLAEKERIENEKRLRLALEVNNAGAWEVNLRTQTTTRTLLHDQIFGYKTLQPHWTFKTFLEHVIPEDKETTKFLYLKAVRTNSVLNFECRIKRTDDEIRWVSIMGKQIIDSKGETSHMTGVVQDITEQKEAEKEVKESQEKYQSLFNNSPVPLWEEDFSGVKKYIKTLQKRNISDFSDYFKNNPDEVKECAQLIKINDVNTSVLKLLEAESKEDFHNGLPSIFTNVSYEDFTEELITIAKGRLECEFESTTKTLKGNEKHVYLKWMVVPGYEDSLKKVYISTIDISDRKKYESEILKSQKRLSEAERIGEFGNWSNELATGTIEWSEGMYRIFGLDPKKKDISYELLMECIHEEDREKHKNYFEQMQNLLPGQHLEPIEYRIVLPNAETRWIVSDFETKFKEQKPTSFFGTTRNITEKKKAEEKTRATEEILKNTFDLSPSIIAKADINKGSFIQVNKTVTKILGYSIDEFTSKPYMEFVHPNDIQSTIDIATEQLKGNDVTFFENRYLCKDGSYKWMAWHATKPNDDGVVTAIGSDINERKKAEIQLTESQEKYRKMIETSNDLIWILDQKGNFTFLNTRAEKATGYLQNDLKGKSFTPLVMEDELPFLKEVFERTMLGESVSYEMRLQTISGKILTLAVNTVPFSADDGIKAMFSFARDITDYKELLKTLQQRNEYIETILENMPIGFALNTISDGDVKFMNNKFESIYGWSSEILSNTSVFFEKVFPNPEYRAKMQAQIVADMESGDIERMNWDNIEIVTSSGEVRYVHAFNIPLIEQNLMISTVQDITLQNVAQKALVESEQRLNEAQRMAAIGYWIQDVPSNKLTWSDETYRIFEVAKDFSGELLDKFFESIHPEDRDAVTGAYQNSLKTKEPYEISHRIQLKDGRIKYIHERCETDYDKNGTPIRSIGTVQDVTKLRRIEKDLIRSQEKLDFALQGGEIGIWEWDLASDLTIWDAKMEHMFGLNTGEFNQTYDAFKDCLHPDDIVSTENAIKNAIEGVSPYDTVYRIIWKNKEVKYIQAKALVLKDAKGKPTTMVGICIDVSTIKKVEEELIKSKEKAEESDRLKSAFLANMSHEIRTPMNGILGFSNLLKEPKLTGEQQKKYISVIEKSGERMLNIINDIIDISKIESGLMTMDITESDVNEQLEYIYTFFRPEVEAKGMKLLLNNTLPSKEAIIKTDREKVFAILTNLVKNAIKYSNKGHIEIGYNKKGNTLEFFVKDTGIGIPKNRQNTIFERFIQVDIEDKMARQGAGLGLAITKAYVEMLGGNIWVESEEENLPLGKTGSSIFYFTIPYNPFYKQEIIHENNGDPSLKLQNQNLEILITEDDESSEMLLEIMVENIHKKIIKAKTGPEAIKACQDNPDIDLILMDIQLPGMNGYEATRQIRKFNKEVIIIAQTAYGLTGDKEKAIKAGCNDYISKPIKQDELFGLIQQYFKNL